jgi:hypothetical protein
MDRVLDCQFYRRFGVEIELNTSSGIIRVLDSSRGDTPEGATLAASLISRTLRRQVKVNGWHITHNNAHWVVKPDASCGIEVCSPVLKGWRGLESVMRATAALKAAGFRADSRCSLHVHVNIADLKPRQLATVLAYYVKCEHVLFDSLPWHRKNNRYCQMIGLTDQFEHDFDMDQDELIRRLASMKYFSLNAYHFMKGGGFTWANNRRQTIEFRVAEGDACLDPLYIKCWVRFLLHFVEMTKNAPYPKPFDEARPDPRAGLLWLDSPDVYKLLGFDRDLSAGLRQVRDWFMMRSLINRKIEHPCPVIFTAAGRVAENAEFYDMCASKLKDMNPDDPLPDLDLYGNMTRI